MHDDVLFGASISILHVSTRVLHIERILYIRYTDDVMQKCMHYHQIVFNVASDCHSIMAGKLCIMQSLGDKCCRCTGFTVTVINITDSNLCMCYYLMQQYHVQLG